MTIQGLVRRQRRRLGRSERDGEDRVGSVLAFILGAVSLDHALIDARLIQCVVANQQLANRPIGMTNGRQDTLAKVAFGVTIA